MTGPCLCGDPGCGRCFTQPGARWPVEHQRQPTKTSCGPTCAAMLAGVPVEQILARLPKVRTPKRRAKRARSKPHATNVGEMVRLLQPFDLRLGRRLPGLPPARGLFLLRVQHGLRAHRGDWHFAVVENGQLFDPALAEPVAVAVHLADTAVARVSFYEVEGVL